MSVEQLPAADLVQTACPLCGGTGGNFVRKVDGYTLERCRGCGLVFNNPRLSDAALDKVYSDRDTAGLIAFYERMHTPAVIGQFDVKLARLERGLPQKGRLLDFGCGAGYFLHRAQQRGWDAHGVELGPWAAEAARRRGVPNLNTARLQDMAFPDGHFDVVNASQVFEHLTHPLPELAEIRRVLKPGGVFLIDVPNYHTLPILLNADDFMLNAPPQHVAFYTPRTLRKLLTAGGLKVDRVFSSSGLKWENLLGKPVRSDIASAHTDAPAPPKPQRASGLMGKVKGAVRGLLIDPLFYRMWKVGMLLEAEARKG
jgi:SAM-dependent methyltransferase